MSEPPPKTDERSLPSLPSSRPASSKAPSSIPISPQTGSTYTTSASATPFTEPTPLSSANTDRVFPIRSVVSLNPSSTPAVHVEGQDGYFHGVQPTFEDRRPTPSARDRSSRKKSLISSPGPAAASAHPFSGPSPLNRLELPPQSISKIASEALESRSLLGDDTSTSFVSAKTTDDHGLVDTENDYITTRFKHVTTEDGHAIITGRDGEALQRCEDEPIHIPGSVQSFGLLIALEEIDGKFLVKVVSENSYQMISYTPRQLFALDNFTDVLTDDQADNLLDHIDFVRDQETDVERDGPELFTITIRPDKKRPIKLWCAMHINQSHPSLLICEFELENDVQNPLVHPDEATPNIPADTLQGDPTRDEFAESTENLSKPLRVLRSARRNRGEAAAMEVFNIMSQIQEQLAHAPDLDVFLKVLVGVCKELTGFHRVMIYQFDKSFNGRVVTELVDPRATKDLYKGLHFPASDIPRQARELYKVNRVRLLYDRDQETARLVCRTLADLDTPLDMTHSFLRAMSPIHIKYLQNMAVKSSMSISINAFGELWGLISCHSYGNHGTRVSFPIRKMCRLVGDTASRNIERLSYASRLQARKLINTTSTSANPSGYIIASSEDLLKLFNADFGLLCIQDEAKMLGHVEVPQETLAMLEYLKVRKFTSVTATQDVNEDFPDLSYTPGFQVLSGMLLVPLSVSGTDFIAFFRRGQLREVKWAGNPYEKFVRAGTAAFLEPRKSFKIWSETVVGKCREWTEEEIETAAVLCLVYGKFIEVWRQKEAALQNSQLTKILLANSAHEVRTPLNAIINYLEIALENLGTESALDKETRDYLTKSHSASKSLIYVINDLLDLTKTEEGIDLLISEAMPLEQIIQEAIDVFQRDATRKGIEYKAIIKPGLPQRVLGDQRKIRQAVSNVIANAIKYTNKGLVNVDVYMTSLENNVAHIEIVVQDTGIGMSAKQLDDLFMHLEQVEIDESSAIADRNSITNTASNTKLGLGLAIVARIIRTMNGQLRLKSEEDVGSRFVMQLPFELPKEELSRQASIESPAANMRPKSITHEKNEVLLVNSGKEMSHNIGNQSSEPLIGRSNSSASNKSKGGRSVRSFGSQNSVRSDVDRLIEAIQAPNLVDNKLMSESSSSLKGTTYSRPGLEQRRYHSEDVMSFGQIQALRKKEVAQEHSALVEKSGEQMVEGSMMPLRAIRVPEEEGTPMTAFNQQSPSKSTQKPVEAGAILGPEQMNVLVAEDDPINSKIIKKRLEKAGHHVFLTVNGEECATSYEEKEKFFDVVLMDMQMPIVDGLESTKMIRKFEKTRPTSKLSQRAFHNGRVPIIAVSASLLEKERRTYIDAGFDAWILKPISFDRLAILMEAIVNQQKRKDVLYEEGQWERGGWFSIEGVKASPEQDALEIAEQVIASP